MTLFDACGHEVRPGILSGYFLPIWVRVRGLCPAGRGLTYSERRAELAYEEKHP